MKGKNIISNTLRREIKLNTDVETEYDHPVDRGWSWVICFASFLSYFIIGISIQAQAFLFLEMASEFIASYTMTSLSLMVFMLAFSFSSIVSVTVLVPKYGEKKVTIAAGFIFSLCSVGFAASTAIEAVIALSGVQGAAAGTIIIPVVSMLGQYFKDKISLAMSISSIGICFANITAPPLLQVLFKLFGLRNTYLILSGMEMVTAGMFLGPVSAYRKKVRINISNPHQVGTSDFQVLQQPESLAVDDTDKSNLTNDNTRSRKPWSILRSMSVSIIDQKEEVLVQPLDRHRYRSVTFAPILEETFSAVCSVVSKEHLESTYSDKDDESSSPIGRATDEKSDDGQGISGDGLSVPPEQENVNDELEIKIDFIRGISYLCQYDSKDDDGVYNTGKTGRKMSKREPILSSSVSLDGDVKRISIRETAAQIKRLSANLNTGPIRRKLSSAIYLEIAAAGLERDLMASEERRRQPPVRRTVL